MQQATLDSNQPSVTDGAVTDGAVTDGAVTDCLHCGASLSLGQERFCCGGCERVHGLVSSLGLNRYYDLRTEPGLPGASTTDGDENWLHPLDQKISEAEGLTRVAMDVQGVHCAACVWMINELFERQDQDDEAGAGQCVVNPGRGQVELWVGGDFDLQKFVRSVQSVGYRMGPALKGRSGVADDLTLRMGLSLFLASNTMMLSLAMYLGLSEGEFFQTARQVIFGLSAATMWVGGSYFVKRAWRSVKKGLLHLDLPIALGLSLAFLGSAYGFFAETFGPKSFHSDGQYFDTVSVFVALMLVGRWLQDRALARNRAQLLQSDGVNNLFCRRVMSDEENEGKESAGEEISMVRASELRRGDTLWLAPGDLVAVDARLLDEGELRLDWIAGESDLRPYLTGSVAPAGSFNAGRQALKAVAETDFADSELRSLLALPAASGDETSERGGFWDRLSRFYVVAVLGAGASAFFSWWIWTGDLGRAISVSTAVLVVTCPCAFGIAAPLAKDMVQSALRRTGLYVRTESLLENLSKVKRIVFDKTGTLTTGVPALKSETPLELLEDVDRRVLYTMVNGSGHPKSAALVAALRGKTTRLPGLRVEESVNLGLEARWQGQTYRFGRPDWVGAEAGQGSSGHLAFSRAGRILALLETEEALRKDAVTELQRLREQGYRTSILSGDQQARVERLAQDLGISSEDAIGDCSPQDKRSWLRTNAAEETLFIGDGINDSLVASEALVSGTPAIDRPFMPARTDFYFVSPGLAAIRRLLEAAQKLSRIVRLNLAFALVYNVAALSLAFAGLVTPWLAAVLMPISSLLTLSGTSLALSRRSPWRS